jgi:hypothetical protein
MATIDSPASLDERSVLSSHARYLPCVRQFIDTPAQVNDRTGLMPAQYTLRQAVELILDHAVAHRVLDAADGVLDENRRPFNRPSARR